MTSNRFDFLRLLFASVVFIYHIVVLAQLNLGEAQWVQLAELSIQCFFVISGTLVYGSFIRSQTTKVYAKKRVRRLLPAYLVVILVPSVIALFLTGHLAYVLRYLGWNSLFLNFMQPTLPGVFEGNHITAVNGALWTLKIEVMFYLILPILAWVIAKAGSAKWLLLAVIYITAEIWRQSLFSGAVSLPGHLASYNEQLSRQLPGQMSFFLTGMVIWMFWDQAKKAPIWFLPLGLLFTLLSVFLPVFETLRAAGLGLLIVYIAFAKGPALNAARWGDLSYGVYITHFPITQMLIALGVFAVSPILGILSATVLVFAASFILWHVIEKPSLLPSSHYRQKAAEKKTSV